jgi:hypothetical protein
MTTTILILNLAMSLPALAVVGITLRFVLRPWPGPSNGEGRADWRGPFRGRLAWSPAQRTAASIATATNSSARYSSEK